MCTEDRRNRQYILDVNNLNKNLMIEAGAGSGKTTILVDRLIVQIKETDIKMSELVAITFTEKAADVLKFRFQNKLLVAQKDETDTVKKNRLTEALRNVDDIQISTIHAFCNKILNECPFEANLGPGFGILRNQDETNAKNRFVKEYAKAHKNDLSFVLIKDLGLNALDFAGFFSDLVDEEYNEIECSTINSTPKKYYDEAIAKAQFVCDGVKATWDSKGLSYDELVDATRREKKDVKDGLLKAYDASISKNPKDLRAAIEKLSGYTGKDPAGNDIMNIKGNVTKKDSPVLFDVVKELIPDLGIYNDDICEAMHYLNDLYLSMLAPMAEAYKKSAKRNLSNQELLYYACNLLRNSSKAREYLRNKYQFFYVDEYQDTDPVQTELFLWLVAKNPLTGNNLTEKIQNATLLPGKICYIGDPKQSIYGFRKADITLYTKVKQLIIRDGNSELVQLYANFRSNKEICSWVENVFKNDFAGLKIETDKVPCINKDLLSGVYYYRYEHTTATSDDLLYEAEHIAKMIRGLIDSGCQLYSADRPVEEKDFMVLTPKKKNQINAVVNALKKYGLKVEVDGESSVSSSEEVANLFYILDFVDKPYSALRFAKLIRFVAREHYLPGEDYSEAQKLVSEKDDEVFESKLVELQLSKKVIELVKMLRGLVLRRYTTKPLVLVQQVIGDLGNLVYSGNYEDTKVGYVYGQLEQVFEQLKSKPIASLQCVCEELKSLLEDKELDKELIVRNTSNAVRVMNVHKAKGLEGKIVILAAGRYSMPKHQSSNLYCVETPNGNKIVSEPKDAFSKYSSVYSYSKSYDVYDRIKAEAEWEEHKRLLYVAATRAEEALIIPIPYALLNNTDAKGDKIFETGKENRKGFWGDLIPKCGEDDRVHGPVQAANMLDARLIKEGKVKAERKAEIRKEVYAAYCDILNDNCKNHGKPSEIIQAPKANIPGSNASVAGNKLIYRDDNAYGAMAAATAEVLGKNQLGNISERLVSPSSCEKYNHHNSGKVEAGRMKGNLYGLMLHKTYELLVNRIMLNKAEGIEYMKDNSDDIIEYILPLAVKEGLEQESLNREQCEKLLVPEDIVDELLAKTQSQQMDYLVNHFRDELSRRVKEFLDDKEILEDLLGEPETVAYTELPFAMYMPGEDGTKVFVNGTMDLLIETKDKLIIWDYKSDGRQYLPDSDELESIEDFEAAIGKVYAPQLEMYTEAVKQMIINDNLRKDKQIVVKLYHMYRAEK